jgi:GxxExxY protein
MLLPGSGHSSTVIGCAIRVHSALGPGLLESAYAKCLLAEFQSAGVRVDCQVAVPVEYLHAQVDCAYRADFVVERSLVVEVKSVARLEKVHQAQLLTYVKLLHLREGLLINFNAILVKEGIKRLLL